MFVCELFVENDCGGFLDLRVFFFLLLPLPSATPHPDHSATAPAMHRETANCCSITAIDALSIANKYHEEHEVSEWQREFSTGIRKAEEQKSKTSGIG